MAQEIYHRSEWGNPNEQWGNVYLNADLTNELYKRASEYENSWVTDQLLNGVGTKPSIILTPTAYEDGLLNSVKPAKTFGSELVTNGDFSDSANDWTPNANATLSIDNSRLKVAISGGASGYPSQNITTVVGKKYNITADAFIGTATKVSLYSAAFGFNDLAADGSYNLTFTATSTSTQIRLYVYGDGAYGLWDNVSVKEVIDADFDFTRGSSATRVNEKGLIQDVQILSDELVQNGNFEQIGSEQVTNGDFSNGSADWFNPDNAATFSNNSVTITGGSGNRRINQSNVTSPTSSQWKLQYEITEKVGTSDLKVYTTNSGSAAYEVVPSTIGVHTYFFNTNLTTFYFNFNNSTGSITIDNVSVKEVGQNWSFGGGWSMGDGKAISDGSSNNDLRYETTFNPSILKIKFDVNDLTQGRVRIFVNTPTFTQLINATSNGSYETTVEVTSGANNLYFYSTNNFIGSIDNVSVIEITDDTNLPRIDYSPYSGAGTCGHWLFEPQSTQTATYSNDFNKILLELQNVYIEIFFNTLRNISGRFLNFFTALTL